MSEILQRLLSSAKVPSGQTPLIDQIIAKVEAVPIQPDGSLTLTPADFDLPVMSDFFANVLQAPSVTVASAVRTSYLEPPRITVAGTATVLGNPGLGLLLDFAGLDGAPDQVLLGLKATFAADYAVTPPVIDWITITALGLDASLSSLTGVVRSAAHGQIVSSGGVTAARIPFTLVQAAPSGWAIDLLGDDAVPVTVAELTALLSGQDLTAFLPQALTAILAGIAVTGLSAEFDVDARTVPYFSVGIAATNGWEIAPQVALLPGVSLTLTLMDFTKPERQWLGLVTGAFLLNTTRVPIFVEGSGGASTVWSFGIQPDEQVVIPSFSDLLGLAGGQDFIDSLPAGLSQIPSLLITRLSVSFNPSAATLDEVAFAVETASTWPILPGYFEISNILVALEVHDVTDPIRRTTAALLRATFPIGGILLQCSLQKSATDPAWILSAGLAPGTTLNLGQVAAQLFAGQIELPSAVPTMTFTVLGITVDTKTGAFSFAAHSDDTWNFLGTGTFVIKTFDLTFARSPQPPTYQITGELRTTLTIGGVDILLHASLNTLRSGGWFFEGKTGEEQPIPIGALIAYLAETFGVHDLPEFISGITLQDLAVSFNTATQDFTFGVTGNIPVADGTLAIRVDIAVIRQRDQSFTISLSGTVTLGASTFTIDFTTGTAGSTLSASWQIVAGQSLGFSDIAQALGLGADAPTIPPGLDLQLDSASFSYTTTDSTFVLTASSPNYGRGKAVFVARKPVAGWQFFFGLAIKQTISLSDFPLIGPELSRLATVAFEQLEILVASAELDPASAVAIDQLIPKDQGYPMAPPAGMTYTVGLSMVFRVGDDTYPLTLSLGGSTPAEPAMGVAVLVAESPTAATDGTKWFNIQKSLGPIAFAKVGVRYQDSMLYVLMDASLSVGGLTIALLGLGVGSPLSSFQPEFTIDGLAVTFVEGPVELSGGLVGTLKPVNFYGELVLGFPGLTISALGGYAEAEGRPSFFLYAVLDYPIGGPAFFFVTGLAAGFGFNRSLLIPDVAGVATFPLVQWAVGVGNPPKTDPTGDIAAQVAKVLATLAQSGVIAPAVGQYWAALGIRFTSFELLDSFALLTISLGANDFDVNLLGLSRLQVPPAPLPPVAVVEMALKATFSPSRGLLSVEGQLTTQSYVLSPDCHLTGGFAFYLWFLGEHEGDFVVTLGGYSPRFHPPSHYPAVPRLGMNWQVSKQLTVKGNLYFALTSSAIMAGGAMSAVWKEGGISAWFNVEADFLMVFLPFHYYISARINLGASFTVNLWLTKVTMTVHVGVGLEIWGPDFTGKAEVDLSVISFTIHFGSSKQQKDTTIAWSDFVGRLLPRASSERTRASALPATLAGMRAALRRTLAAAEAPLAVVQITVSRGLLKTLSEQEGALNYVVDSAGFELVTKTAIPSKTFEGSLNIDVVDGPVKPNVDFGVGPTGTPSQALSSTHKITITTSVAAQRFHATPVLANIPKALWEKRQFDSHGVPIVADPLTDTTLPNVVVGYTVAGYALPPHQTPLPVPIANLAYTVDPELQEFTWSDPYYPTTGSFPGASVPSTIDTPPASQNRPRLIDAAMEAGFAVSPVVNVGGLASPTTNYLLAPPVFSLLGEQQRSDA